MNVKIAESWKPILQTEFNKPYFIELTNFVDGEYAQHVCYPKEIQIFSAFEYCFFNDIKIVIIGQDPYHGEGQANGLCFSVNSNVSHPPSLKNIFKELHTDLGNSIPNNGNLEHWAKQGVLLLNATLTVRASEAGSHKKNGWETFTDAVIEQISTKKENVVFLLWGGFAKKKGRKIDRNKHCVLESGHPSPLSANRGFWFGNKHFSKTNEYLTARGIDKITW